MRVSLKTPLTYYGGKQKMVRYILPNIPTHVSYIEPFVGGGAIFWAKPPSEIEVLNDTNKELINFYAVLQKNLKGIKKEVNATLHSRDLHRKAWVIYNNSDLFTDIKRAWAVWVLASQSYSCMLNGSWRYDKSENKTSKVIGNKKQLFCNELPQRLEKVELESADALYIIKSRDSEKSFFYCDPPYYNADCGHYKGYTLQDFEDLLSTLSKIKGLFLLSSYPSPILMEFIKKHKWHVVAVDKKVSVNTKKGYLPRKLEMLTANYPLTL